MNSPIKLVRPEVWLSSHGGRTTWLIPTRRSVNVTMSYCRGAGPLRRGYDEFDVLQRAIEIALIPCPSLTRLLCLRLVDRKRPEEPLSPPVWLTFSDLNFWYAAVFVLDQISAKTNTSIISDRDV